MLRLHAGFPTRRHPRRRPGASQLLIGLREAATNPDVTLRVWEDGEHTIYNHASERTAFVADWFAQRLTPG
ncbi:hypothetical protein D3C72_2219920 [compost metagenome]